MPVRDLAMLAAVTILQAGALSAAGVKGDLDGVWFLAETVLPDDPGLSAEGELLFNSFDPLQDDTDTDCKPVSFTNIMHTPSPPFEIRQFEDHVDINYEFMDVRRRVPLDTALTVETAPYAVANQPHMGRSVGRYEGEILVVENAGVEAGYLDTLGMAGLPQSADMRTEERFVPDGDRLEVAVTHHDSVYYSGPMVMVYRFARLESQIMEWGCTLEGANYDHRMK